MGPLLSWVLIVFVSSCRGDSGIVVGSLTPSEAANSLRSQPFGNSATSVTTPVLFNASTANITGYWVDSTTRVLFLVTRTAGGSGSVFRVGLESSESRAIMWYGGTVAGTIYGLTGTRALNSPSIYYVWNPESTLSPPYNNQPALYRIPLLGGIPEVVTLHAVTCSQMSIINNTLFGLQNGTFYSFDMTRPNSAFFPLSFPTLLLDQFIVAFVASRQGVLYCKTQSGKLVRLLSTKSSSSFESITWPVDLDGSTWGPSLYNEPTDRLVGRLTDGVLLFWIGMEDFWNDAKSGVWTRAIRYSPGVSPLSIVAFSASSILSGSIIGILMTVLVLWGMM